jgi:hypothetical protein
MLVKINGIIVSAGYGVINNIHKTPHKGIDLVLNEGSPLPAVQDGTIIVVNETAKLGKYVMMRLHDGKEVIYGHLSRFGDFKPGDSIQQGQTLGYVGSTGNSTGPHLHLQVMENGHTIDPTPYAHLLNINPQSPSAFQSIKDIAAFFTDMKQNGIFHAMTGSTFTDWLIGIARVIVDSSAEIGLVAAIILVIVGMCGSTRARKWLYWTVIITIILQMIGALI